MNGNERHTSVHGSPPRRAGHCLRDIVERLSLAGQCFVHGMYASFNTSELCRALPQHVGGRVLPSSILSNEPKVFVAGTVPLLSSDTPEMLGSKLSLTTARSAL